MSEIVLHPSSSLKIKALHKQLPHALLLSGKKGVGLLTIAQYIAKMEPNSSVTVLSPDEKGTISIDAVRNLYTQTRTRHEKLQIIIVDDADAMRHEAQNAFLKLLEEPSSKTALILTSHAPSKLLPTVTSRLQEIAIQPVTKKQTEDFLTEMEINNQKMRVQIQFIASGLPAEIYRLHQDQEYFETQAETARDARRLLSASMYEKILLIQKYSSDRSKTLELLQHAMHIIDFSLAQKASRTLANQLDKLLETEKAVQENANAKTQLLKLVISA